MPAEKADVVIVGAGIVGCSAAYFLSQEKLKVVVLEQNAIASGTSGHAPASLGLTLHYTEPPELCEMSRRGSQAVMEMAPAIAEETGIDVGFRRQPDLALAFSPHGWEEIQRLAPKQNLDNELLTAEQCYAREPRLSRDVKLYGGLWCDWAARVDSYRLTLALAQAAQKRGAQFLTRKAAGLVKQGSRVAGVVTSTGERVLCDHVLLATGVWTPEASKWVGVPLPVHPMKGEQLLLDYDGPPIDTHISGAGISNPPMVNFLFTRRSENTYLVGVTAYESYVFDSILREEAKQALLSFAVRLLPCLAEARVTGHMSGPRPIPPDGMPILGPVPSLEGAYVVVGNPGVYCCILWGQLVRDLVLRRPLSYSLKPFLPDRFSAPVQGKYGIMALREAAARHG
ncbi:MAG: FAD-binding oxidoreductase [Chloroflexi bacterium]|nr:FAD-binding oxidoreductase [Chloroflexota bacterium]